MRETPLQLGHVKFTARQGAKHPLWNAWPHTSVVVGKERVSAQMEHSDMERKYGGVQRGVWSTEVLSIFGHGSSINIFV